jgi:DNA-binding LytR/AlgR family response regulator
VIAEDEPLLRTELRETLAALWPELVIAAEVDDGLEAMRALQAHRPDLLFLDIEMPGMTGLQVAAQASRRCHVVFVTAYDKYALAAFEQGAVDYVL